MDQFCQECGKRAEPGNRMCIHCGSPLPSEEEQKQEEQAKQVQTRTQKDKMPKKKKIWYSLIGMILFLLIAGSMWAQSYQSAPSVEKRYTKAIVAEDEAALQELLVREDGSSPSKAEVEAFLQLIKEEGKHLADTLVSIQPHGKFLFLFTAHKAQVIDQYGAYLNSTEELSFTFNETEIDEYSKNKDKVVYGPLIPGVYEVEATFAGKYGKSKKAEHILVANTYGEETRLDLDLNISDVVFYVQNYADLDVSKAFILLGKEEIPVQKDGYTKEIGPVVLDGSQKAYTRVTMPWGEVESTPIDIDDMEMSIQAEVLNEKQYEALRKTLKDFGNQYVEALAKKSAKPLQLVTDDLKKDLLGSQSKDVFYSGKFDKVEIDRHSIQIDSNEKQPKIEIVAGYYFQDTYHEIDEKPNIQENYQGTRMKLSYQTDKKKWKIHEMSPYYGAVDATDAEKGSRKLLGPSKKAVANAKDAAIEDEINDFMQDYTRASVDAINYRDFGLVKDYTDKNGPRWKETEEYIDYLDSKGIYEDWLYTELENVKKTSKDTWEVTVKEAFTIHGTKSSNDKEFRTKVIVKQLDDQFKVHKLIETNEI